MSKSSPIIELTLEDAWSVLRDDPTAVLVDVRTPEEWNFVGVPVLESIEKSPRFVHWTAYGTGDANPAFLAEATNGLGPDTPLLFLCRSGARSTAAARAVSSAGFVTTYNITAGFEGDLDSSGHRTTGWRHAGLPWRQG